MSNVRVSNGSPPLERMEARLSEQPKPSACRVLFGVPDHDELRRELNERLREMEEAKRDEWNFDFSVHMPLPHGRYRWEIVEEAPEFYGGARRATGAADLNGRGGSTLEGDRGRRSAELSERSQGRTDCREQLTRQRKRRASPEPQNKRLRTSSDGVTGSPVVSHSVENTPRKSSPKTQT